MAIFMYCLLKDFFEFSRLKSNQCLNIPAVSVYLPVLLA